MPSYAQSELNTEVTSAVSGSFSAADFLTISNRAVREVLLDVDLRSTIRVAALSPNLFDEIYAYTCPSDIKGDKIIDIQPQVDRGRFDYWKLITREEFDRTKQDNSEWMEENLVAFARDDLTNKLLLSRVCDDTSITLGGLNAVGDWEAFGDGTNLTADTDNYVKGNASINWDINADGGTTAGIVNSSVTTFDISKYKSTGSIFVWAYVTSATNLTNFIIRVGSSSSAYYSVTVTTNNEGAAFSAGWNLLRFSLSGKSTTGTPDDDACDYVALYMTKDGAKVSETDYRFDNIVMKIGSHYDTIYYSRYLWQSSTGTYLEDATATTDVLNCETDEFPLFILKTNQLIEEHLKKYDLADRQEARYENKKAKYILDNPSKSLTLIQQYYNL